jgi:hypothetical protein
VLWNLKMKILLLLKILQWKIRNQKWNNDIISTRQRALETEDADH